MNILIINAHPDKESFCNTLAISYKQGCEKAGRSCKIVNLIDLEFSPILQYGYRIPMELEPDLIEMQEFILSANHIVFVFPIWWGTYPALLKGFIDRVFLPGFAFSYKPNSLMWEKKLKGRTATIISTMNTPYWYYRWIYKRPAHYSIKKGLFEYCGIQPIKLISFSPIKNSSPELREKWINSVFQMGEKSH